MHDRIARTGIARTGIVRAAGFGIAAALLALMGPADAQEQAGPLAGTPLPYAGADGSSADGPTLSVLTYNIEGLPAPFAWGRSSAAAQIAARLTSLRAEGRQPHVVVLQEAFGEAQRSIGREAGYRYVAFGPDRDLRNDEPMTDADRAFAAKSRFVKGETIGKWRGSGLAILSDYPIVAVKRAAFPSWACAGYDCLANKGVMLAEVRVPGVDKPVAVIATHMNSKDASGVGKARWNAAFDRQARTIGRFLATNLPADAPYVFAGDTNVGKSPERRAWLADALPRSGGAAAVRLALATCLGKDSGCAVEAPAQAEKAFRHGKDWQVYADGATVRMRPLAIAIPFGADAHGHMLSDHIGYTTLYRLAAS